jgi:hypothetical protein
MTDENSTDTSKADAEPQERKRVTITLHLDPAHRRMDLALRESGLNVDGLLAEDLTPVAEKLLHDLLQEVKYGDSNE